MKYRGCDFYSSYTPNSGEVNILVIPFSLKGAKDASKYSFSNWTTTALNKVSEYYFGEDGGPANGNTRWFSFKDYYAQASYGKVEIKGLVAPLYTVNSSTSIAQINKDSEDLSPLYDLFDEITTSLQQERSDIDWSKFDRNGDGFFDAVHFISDFYGANWADNLWPHMFYTLRPAKEDQLRANVYSLSSIEHFSDSTTAIHEQGHMFGLDDYYDYSGEGYEFASTLDMQSSDIFDWNAYSKLVCGWIDPTVITGERESVTLTVSSDEKEGGCLLIPADYSSWNGTAYSEYFLFDLFGRSNQNQDISFNIWNSQSSSKITDGVKAFYVNATGFEYYEDGTAVQTDVPTGNKIQCYGPGANNSFNYEDYDNGVEEYADSPLLTLVSKKNKGKFAKANPRTMTQNDLFVTGDKFTFELASTSMRKGGESVATMWDGKVFPYEVVFDKVTATSMTVTVTKVA